MVRAKKKWGQHWLASRKLATDLVALVEISRGEHVIEIGPGTGLLTAALLDQGAEVTAVEIDPDCADRLQRGLPSLSLSVVRGDIRKVSENSLPWRHAPVRVVGNLPYNLSGPILRWITHHRAKIRSAHFMLQREVAERIVAPAGSRTYGALSVQMQWNFEASICKRLSRGAFRPEPNVESAFVALQPRARVSPAPGAGALVRAGFGQRRKTLVRALQDLGIPAERIRAALDAIGQRPDARAEALSPDDWHQLAQTLERP